MEEPEVIPSDGERMIYEVRSDRNPKIKYRCDLTAEGGYGRCNCADFSIRRWLNIQEKRPMGTRDVLCKHLRRARDYFLNALLTELAKQESNP